ncbi:unnamed protein product [Aphanomyces euteiches]|uniref:Choloylglycine hydrolase/NAAA C-terminal domain-containing protein n=1 Tax=Aphanomyces euteiches TaxID=100861 RepID=A0A6G0XTX4_9STRA|nr:hypothetical protein Ae201684_001534 [Aphanomyces euteiches]KAH9075423.1 hypothetical protein Ae201684P_004103 [Aphanomyces euteiches]KAH9150785.1 hypothetical protein AeRB84_006439 [Aphanomyces euteiches]
MAFFLALLVGAAIACSDILLNLAHETISARTMDFGIDLQSTVEVVPRGTVMQELVVNHCEDCPDFGWSVKHGFVAFNMVGVNIATDGLNEAGLSAAWLYLYATKYPRANASDPRPVITSLVSYFLGNFATVDEVKAQVNNVQFAEFDPRLQTLFAPGAKESKFPLHVAIHDAKGKSIVLEFLNGTLHVYDNPGGVMTNDPTFEKHLQQLADHGDKPIPGTYSSSDRFIRLSLLNQHAATPFTPNTTYSRATPEQAAVSTALHLINTVAIQTGDIAEGEATQFTVVRDHGRRTIYFLANENQLLRRLHFGDIDFGSPNSRRAIPVTFGDWFVDLTKVQQESSLRSIDLPPRSIVEQLLNGSTSPSQLAALAVAHAATSAPMIGFWGGLAVGFICAVALAVLVAYYMRPVPPSKRAAEYTLLPYQQ